MAHAYSTGPLENAVGLGSLTTTESKTAWSKVLNNNHHRRIRATIRVFRLNGAKTLIDRVTLAVGPGASGFHVSDVSGAPQFEVQIAISPGRGADDVLVGVFGKDEAGNLNPSHRLVHQELTPIDDLSYLDDDPDAQASDERQADGSGS